MDKRKRDSILKETKMGSLSLYDKFLPPRVGNKRPFEPYMDVLSLCLVIPL